MTRRPERHFWYFVALLSGVMLLGLSGQLISCAEAKPPASGGEAHHVETRHPGPGHVASGHVQTPPAKPWNQLPPPAAAGPGVHLGVQTDRAAVLHRGDGIVRVEVNVTPQGSDASTVDRASDILVVVDTSGSMEGQKLHFARQALFHLFERLGPEDRFGLIEYSSQAQLLVPLQSAAEHNKTHFRAVTHGLRAQGSTNMSDGLDTAMRILRPEMGRGRPARVLLLSDGLANAGDSTLGGLSQRARALSYDNVAVTTMGIGVDFDETVMTAVATAGTGAFYYLANLRYLPEFFQNELSSTRETYAQAAEIVFYPAPGVRLESAMGLPFERRGAAQVVRLGSLYGSRTRTVWLTLRVATGTLGDLDLGHVSLGYERHGADQRVAARGLPRVHCIDDYRTYQRQIRKPVWERAMIHDVFTTTEEKFGDAIRSGSRAELERAARDAEAQRKLAQALDSEAVIQRLDELKTQAREAEQAQRAPAPIRNRSAKQRKASGYQQRNSAVYKDSAAAMEAY